MADKKYRHPDADTNHQISVRQGSEESYESQGWVEVGSATEADKK